MMRSEYDSEFLASEPWRIFRIMAEFIEGTEEMARIRPAVSIFGSARTQEDDPYYEQGRALARSLSDDGFHIITGGGPGIMEAANRGAKEGSEGMSVGLNIELPFEQTANPYIQKELTFRYFFVRKVMFLKYSCAVVVLPGGFGTMDEMFESLTLIQTQKMPGCPVYLVGVHFWQGLIDWLRSSMLPAGNISPEDMDLFKLTDDLDEVVAGIHTFREDNGLAKEPSGPPAPGGGM